MGDLKARIAILVQENARFAEQIKKLSEQVAKLSKNSSNSSKPPSSDIVKPPKPPLPSGRRKRRIVGQPGHSRHERQAFSAEQNDEVRPYTLDCCPDCGGKLKRLTNQARVIQQVEMICQPVEIVEHRAEGYRCPHCASKRPMRNAECGRGK